MHRLEHRAWFVLVCVALAQGCGDEGGDTGAAGMAGGDPNGFGALYAEILAPTCTAPTCHGGDAGRLNMSTRALAYANLVGVAAAGPNCGLTDLVRVVPGDSAGSLLLTKLDISAAPCGVPMPVGGMLPSPDIARLAAWVDAGALDN
jgi:hypothetical protein